MSKDYFGFSENPFEITPDSKFLFLTAAFEEALASVLEGIEKKRGLILLSGEVGTGKTLLLREVIKRLPEGIPSAFLFHSTFTYPELLREIIKEFGRDRSEEKAEDPEILLEAFLQGLREEGKSAVVCLDEAHKLNERVSRKLVAFLERERWIPEVLQLVLSGQPEIETVFHDPVGKFSLKRPVPLVRLKPLSPEESRTYIEHRLRIVGRNAADLFSEEALALIVSQARGIPRWINTLCDNALFTTRKRLLRTVDANAAKEAIQTLEGPGYLPLKPRSGASPFPVSPIPGKTGGFHKARWGIVLLVVILGVLWVIPEVRLPFTSYFQRRENSLPRPAPPSFAVRIPEGKTPLPEPRSVPAQTVAAETEKSSPGRWIKVQKGQNLSTLIYLHYGRYSLSLADWVLLHNPSIKDVNRILVDQKITFPLWNEEALVFPDPKDGYRILLGTFGTLREAEVQKEKIKSLVAEPTIVQHRPDPRRTWYRLVSGPYATGDKALAVVKELKTRHLFPVF